MFPNIVQFLGHERDRERLQEAEHIRLVKIARGEPPNYGADCGRGCRRNCATLSGRIGAWRISSYLHRAWHYYLRWR